MLTTYEISPGAGQAAADTAILPRNVREGVLHRALIAPPRSALANRDLVEPGRDREKEEGRQTKRDTNEKEREEKNRMTVE